MSDLTLAETEHLQKIMAPKRGDIGHFDRVLCESLERKGFCHVVDDGPYYWAIAQTPEEASAARCILIPGYKPAHGPEWLAELERQSTP
jgi:hypothetical protein